MKASNTFSDFRNDDANVSPAERAKIEFEVKLIGKLIAAREAKGLTQQQLPEAAGIKQSAVARMETFFSPGLYRQSVNRHAKATRHGVPFRRFKRRKKLALEVPYSRP